MLFGVKSAPDLMTPFTDVPATGPTAVFGQPDTFDLIVPAPPSPSHGYLLYVSLL